MNLVGLTGGIGSGKSTVAGIFSTLGIPVFESDTIAKSLMANNTILKKEIIALLGEDAYDGIHLNKKFIASQIFADNNKREKINSLVHPAVYNELIKWSALANQTTAPYLIQESAILLEEDLTARLRALIVVVADENIRITRVTKRDGVEESQVKKRMQHQWPDSKKIPFADYIIYNDANRSLISQVVDIDLMIRASLITAC